VLRSRTNQQNTSNQGASRFAIQTELQADSHVSESTNTFQRLNGFVIISAAIEPLLALTTLFALNSVCGNFETVSLCLQLPCIH